VDQHLGALNRFGNTQTEHQRPYNENSPHGSTLESANEGDSGISPPGVTLIAVVCV